MRNPFPEDQSIPIARERLSNRLQQLLFCQFLSRRIAQRLSRRLQRESHQVRLIDDSSEVAEVAGK